MGVESVLFRYFQVVYNAESELKQRWSALTFSESERISAKILWDLNQGPNSMWQAKLLSAK